MFYSYNNLIELYIIEFIRVHCWTTVVFFFLWTFDDFCYYIFICCCGWGSWHPTSDHRQATVSVALFLAATIYFPATPPSPPSESAAAKRQQSGGGYARLLPTSPQAAWWYRPTQVVFKNWELYIIGIITSHQLQYCWCLCNTSVVI